MLTIYSRAYMGDADLAAIVELQAAAHAVEPQIDPITVDLLRDEYNEPDFDLDRDLRLWEADGKLVMFAEMAIKPSEESLDGILYYRIHPAAYGAGLDYEALAWGEARLLEAAAERGARRRVLRVYRLDSEADRLDLWSTLGYRIVRYSFHMRRPLDEPVPELAVPQGFTLRPLAGEHEIAAWVDCYNGSFIDHYNFHPQTVENLRHWNRTDDYLPELDLVAEAEDGTIAAFCRGSIIPSVNALLQRSEGWIDVLGTRRGYRRRGLGRVMLLAGLRALAQAGVDDAKLGVDAENPNGALRLYESVGFRRFRTWVSHAKELKA